MRVISISKARQNFYKLVDETIMSSEPVQITSKRGDAVLLSEADWKAIQETLYLLSIPGMKESIIKSGKEKTEDCVPMEDLDW